MNETRESFKHALAALLSEEYQRGLNDGLNVAESIHGWLTRTPDTNRQAETRDWARKAIDRTRREKGGA